MDLYDIAIARKLSGGGGGDSGGFSTANLTISGGDLNAVVPCMADDGIEMAMTFEGSEYEVVLWNGVLYFSCLDDEPPTVSISGDITYDSETWMFTITGDCTINVESKE